VALARLRAEGADPAHAAAAADWNQQQPDDGPTDLAAFARDVLPRLAAVPLRVMAEATGLSEGYCSFVRRGQRVPHRRHRGALARLGDVTADDPNL
jgi:hypothetical protein